MLLAVRVLAVWLLIITAEVVHGIVRALVLTPVVGDFRARQIGVFTGSLLIVLTSALTIRWIRASRPRTLLIIGSAWVVLTVAFRSVSVEWWATPGNASAPTTTRSREDCCQSAS